MVENLWTREKDYAWRNSLVSSAGVHYDPTTPAPIQLDQFGSLLLLGGLVAGVAILIHIFGRKK